MHLRSWGALWHRDPGTERNFGGGQRIGKRSTQLLEGALFALLRTVRGKSLCGIHGKVSSTMAGMQTLPVNLHAYAMEFAVPAPGFRIVPERVVLLAICDTQRHGASDVVVVVEGEPAGFLREALHRLI